MIECMFASGKIKFVELFCFVVKDYNIINSEIQLTIFYRRSIVSDLQQDTRWFFANELSQFTYA
jgi:hypothetical protein